MDHVNAVTSWDLSLYGLMKVDERSNTLARLLSCREDVIPADDALPPRTHEGKRLDPEQLLTARCLHEMAGCGGDTDRPPAARLAQLEVDTSVFQTA